MIGSTSRNCENANVMAFSGPSKIVLIKAGTGSPKSRSKRPCIEMYIVGSRKMMDQMRRCFISAMLFLTGSSCGAACAAAFCPLTEAP